MSIVNGLKRRYFRRDFDFFCRSVLQTKPVDLDESSGVVVLSQSYHVDLIMYLVAAKTFAHYIRPEFFVIVDDGFSDDDKRVIRDHLRRVEFVARKNISAPSCPVGGCWERLLTIGEFCKNHFVIQLDSDTVTVADPLAVRNMISAQTSFTLPTRQGRDFVPVVEASLAVSGSSDQHVQIQAEKALAKIPELSQDYYIRGCAGFAGFAKNAISRDAVERFSFLMSNALGADIWNLWGSEQVSSNYLIANSPSKGVLPFDDYPYWGAGTKISDAKLIHFIGGHRFASSDYRKIAMDAIKRL